MGPRASVQPPGSVGPPVTLMGRTRCVQSLRVISQAHCCHKRLCPELEGGLRSSLRAQMEPVPFSCGHPVRSTHGHLYSPFPQQGWTAAKACCSSNALRFPHPRAHRVWGEWVSPMGEASPPGKYSFLGGDEGRGCTLPTHEWCPGGHVVPVQYTGLLLWVGSFPVPM